jgi:hypothetical protein
MVPQGVIEKLGVRGEGGAYNTLLDGRERERGATFGSWLEEKWRGVKV